MAGRVSFCRASSATALQGLLTSKPSRPHHCTRASASSIEPSQESSKTRAAGSCHVERSTEMTLTLARLALTALASAASVLALPAAIAQADSAQSFVSPSGNIVCGLGVGLDGKASASCEIRDYSFTAPHCAQGGGNEFSVTEGQPATPRCHTDTNFVPGRPVLQYGQARS